MICKECGAGLTPDAQLCEACGSEVPATKGGIGFWDLLEGPLEGYEGSRLPSMKNENQLWGQKRIHIIVVAIVAAAILGLAVTSALLYAQLNQLRNDVTERIVAFENRATELESRTNLVEKSIVPMLETASVQLLVEAEPSDKVYRLGDAGDEPIFDYQVLGTVTSFCWERKKGDGRWERIGFDDTTKENEKYGLMLQEDLSEGFSRLWPKGINKESAGTYRCVATDIHDETLEVEATLEVVTDDTQDEKANPTASKASHLEGDADEE